MKLNYTAPPIAPDSTGPIFKRLLKYAQNYRVGFILAIVGMVVYSSIDAFFFSQIQTFIDKGLTQKNSELLFYMGLAIPFIFIARGIANFIATYSLSWVGTHVVNELRQDVFNHLMKVPVSFHDQNSTGDMIAKITYDIEQVQAASSKALMTLVREGAFVLGLLVVMFYLSWQLSLVFLVIGPVVGVVVKYVSRRFRMVSKRIQKAMGNVTSISEQMLNGHKVVVMHGAQNIESDKFADITRKTRQQQMKLVSTRALSVSAIQIIASLALASVLLIASNPSFLDSLTTGAFTTVLTCMMTLLRPLKLLTTVNSEFQKGMAACASVFELLDEAAENDCGEKVIERAKGKLELSDLNFTYLGKEQPTLTDINLTIEPGTTVALVGKSGSGKSTITNLLTRFYEYDSGDIKLDGMPIRSLKLASLRQQFAMVSQHVILFNDTIANNIAYGMLDSVSREQIEAAAKAAYVTDFTDSMPQGLDTQVGENGMNLSGGQRQRITIARAILRDAPVLILDEATSALDTESEKRIQTAIESLSHNKTVIVVAHRLSTIEKADKIVVMDKGKIIESGTHQSLLAQNGVYRQIYDIQFVGH
ncbi:lipid A export permease/ATP-binding protein MsbA [Catenovulum sp. 2E275]|uniref:lipid A export permease/ATP-binding protein MsbA n=1 Tax=Catenovulum sp. 2E275 TaxID=2980497 RepID=UPI0021D04CE7|nr:lipid A export permease/ATP-binding protein MsbA [Catenovulum sp. 2E275]MCU4675663.1 lipid A export permease/ATP-binding protein MsbA [Catenovulum sp. 2E275]